MPWTWYGPPVYRYRDEQGRFVSKTTIDNWGRAAREAHAQTARGLASYLAETGDLSTWQAEMRSAIKESMIQQATLAAGGRNQMTPQMWGSVGGLTAKQYRFLDQFAARIAAGEYSEAQIGAYSEMYLQSTGEAYERVQSRIRGLPTLPFYPKDGNTQCLTRCACVWEYHFNKETGLWECVWRLNPVAENCPDCIDNASRWSEADPLLAEPA
jgi:hypothetical protein